MNNNRIVRPVRVIFLCAVPLLLGCICVLSLYNTQILQKSAFAADMSQTTTRVSVVPAARGDITDRYGRLLVTDAVSYSVKINRELLTASDDPNGALLGLIDCVSSFGLTHTDTLPVSADAPFSYTDMSERLSAALDQYTAHFNISGADADELMDYFRVHYSIPDDYTPAQARAAAGVRWELERRTLFGGDDYVFVSDPGIDVISAISERAFPGVFIDTSAVRRYLTDCAEHVLGSVGPISREDYEYYASLGYPMNAVVGRDGAEKVFEQYLHGHDGELVTVYTDGKVTDSYYSVEPQAGSTVSLTLDIYLQQAAQKALSDKIKQINDDRLASLKRGEEFVPAECGAVVVVEVGTGDVLAMASCPGYDLDSLALNYSELLSDPLSPLFNRALQGRYAPGSTFKPVTGTAALQEGIITPDTKIYDRGIIDEYSGYTFTCWAYPGSHGNIDIRQALQHSCNYFFYDVGRSVGIDTIDRYAEAYGLGQPTGIELYEDTGVLASSAYKQSVFGEPWYTGDTLQAAIGQSYNLFTPMQLACYAATIASGGTRWAAHILRSVASSRDSSDIYRYQPKVLSTVDAESGYFDVIHDGMNMAAKYGSASYVFYNYPVEVCAKTGTAQIIEGGVNNAVFIAFAPYENPEIAVSVVVEKGNAGYYLAEVARDIFDFWFSRREDEPTAGENLLIP